MLFIVVGDMELATLAKGSAALIFTKVNVFGAQNRSQFDLLTGLKGAVYYIVDGNIYVYVYI